MSTQNGRIAKPLPGVEVNYTHPLGRGLVCAYLFNEGSGYRYYDTVDSAVYLSNDNIPPNGGLDYISGITGREWSGKVHVGNYGAVVNQSSIGTDKNLPVGAKVFSVFWKTARSNTGNICEWQFGSSGTTGAMRAFRCTGAGSASFLGWSADLTVSTPFAVTNVWNIWCVTYDLTTLRIYQNGVLAGSGPLTLSGVSNGNLRIAIDTFNSGVRDNSAMDFWYCYNRVLTANEVRALTIDPFQQFKSAPSLLLFRTFADASLSVTTSDAISLSDSIIPLASFFELFSDTISLADSLLIGGPNVLTFSDSIVLSDIISLLGTGALTLTDSFTLSDLITYLCAGLIQKNDSLSYGDLLTISAVVFRMVNDNILITDSISTESDDIPALGDTFSFTDNLSLALSVAFGFADTLSLLDVVALRLSVNSNITVGDALSLIDSVEISLSNELDSYLRRYLNDVVR